MDTVLVTGAGGFIGHHVVKRLVGCGYKIIGVDNMNNYYDIKLKYDRENDNGISYYHYNIEDLMNMDALFKEYEPKYVIHLAAQAGVRYSIERPDIYIKSNVDGFSVILECCKKYNVKHLVYASSSSIYGSNTSLPFKETDPVDHPISLYAATKKANELLAHTYSHLFKLPTTGLRFFTVYGPWGRPDMAPMLFTNSILKGKTINVYNQGDMSRDFTYVDDIVDAVVGVIFKPAEPNINFDKQKPEPCISDAPYMIFNVGNGSPVNLMDFIIEIEKNLYIVAKKNLLPMQPGDVKRTWANVDALSEWIGYSLKVNIEEGVSKFINWYIDYYKKDICGV